MKLINPSDKEFRTSYLNDNNESVDVILAPNEEREFPESTGNVVLNHLANFILNDNNFDYKTEARLELDRIKKTCISSK